MSGIYAVASFSQNMYSEFKYVNKDNLIVYTIIQQPEY